MGYKEHAMIEFGAAGWLTDDGTFKEEMQELMCTQVLELLALFSEHGHSGSSAPYAVSLFSKLAKHDIITPIYGGDDEWNEVGENTYQNNRLSSVFKEGADGRPYFIDAIVFTDEDGCSFTGSSVKYGDGLTLDSRQFINFPFTPKTFYVDVVQKEVAKDDFESTVQDAAQLTEPFLYYIR